MGVILTILFLYLMYRFVAGFVLPLYRTTKQFKEQVDQFKDQVNEQGGYRGQSPDGNRTFIKTVDQKPRFDAEGEYIPFEETKTEE